MTCRRLRRRQDDIDQAQLPTGKTWTPATTITVIIAPDSDSPRPIVSAFATNRSVADPLKR